jgi:hypothetical protein
LILEDRLRGPVPIPPDSQQFPDLPQGKLTMPLKRPAVFRFAVAYFSVATAVATATFALSAAAQTTTQETYNPTPGQAGKDVVWVPTRS